MAAMTALAVSCPVEDWTELADGASFAACFVQAAGPASLALAVAGSKPAADTNDFVILSASGTASLQIAIDSSDTVWGRGLSDEAVARLLLTAAA